MTNPRGKLGGKNVMEAQTCWVKAASWGSEKDLYSQQLKRQAERRRAGQDWAKRVRIGGEKGALKALWGKSSPDTKGPENGVGPAAGPQFPRPEWQGGAQAVPQGEGEAGVYLVKKWKVVLTPEGGGKKKQNPNQNSGPYFWFTGTESPGDLVKMLQMPILI